ncbi:MAG: hypothetical protein HWE13_12125 [Gammaproteobacteria bacterium]|nr:hypothetical protein [Gammaproteobacteria bacterium]
MKYWILVALLLVACTGHTDQATSDDDVLNSTLYIQSVMASEMVPHCEQLSDIGSTDNLLAKWRERHASLIERGERFLKTTYEAQGYNVDSVIAQQLQKAMTDFASKSLAEKVSSCRKMIDVMRSEMAQS